MSDAELRRLAERYVWWSSPDDALRFPHRVIALVMDSGDWEDVRALIAGFPPSSLREILDSAQAGWFRPHSWTYWHYRLGLVEPGRQVRPLPVRRLPG